MLKLNTKEACCGCSACAAVCPKSCIAMTPDAEGFLYPQIDPAQCVDCGLCEKVCPTFTPAPSSDSAQQSVYAAICTDEDIRKESSSGGVFSLIAQYVLAQGGIVYGTAVTEGMKIAHIAVENPDQLYRLRGSKYVQSDPGDAYRQVKVQLKTGRLVLYTGTPCQIGGLKAYLGKEYDNLLCQDLICHGAPAPAVWNRYVQFRQKKAGAAVKSIRFREKIPSWNEFSMRFDFENDSTYRESFCRDPYMKAFLADLCLRPSCYACSFKGQQRQADFTLADFWGVEYVLPQFYDNKGTSLVFVNTDKGHSVFEQLKTHLKLCPADAQAAIAYNSAMLHSAKRPVAREHFFETLYQTDFDKAVARFCSPPLYKRILRRAKQILKKLLKK